MAEKWHLLFEDELTDMPGRCESWTEQVAYLGNGRWRLRIEGSNFEGTKQAEPETKEFDTEGVAKWVMRCDQEDEESGGARTKALAEIAKKVGCKECVEILGGNGLGQSRRQQTEIPRILRILGQGQRSVWIRTGVNAVEVETDQGEGTLVPTKDEAVWHLKLKKQTGMKEGFEVRLEKALLDQIKIKE